MEEEDWVAGREQRQTSMKAKAVVRGGGRHIQGGRRNWAEGRRSVLRGGRSDQDSRVRAEAAQAGEGKWVVGGGSPESEHPPQPRLPPPTLPPPGWDPETGGDAEDGLRPDVLVSLAAPKRCAGRFSGRHHFVAGRFVPDDVRRKFALRLPGYTGTDCVAAL